MEVSLLNLLAEHHPTLAIIVGVIWLGWRIQNAPRSQKAQNGMGADVKALIASVERIRIDVERNEKEHHDTRERLIRIDEKVSRLEKDGSRT